MTFLQKFVTFKKKEETCSYCSGKKVCNGCHGTGIETRYQGGVGLFLLALGFVWIISTTKLLIYKDFHPITMIASATSTFILTVALFENKKQNEKNGERE